MNKALSPFYWGRLAHVSLIMHNLGPDTIITLFELGVEFCKALFLLLQMLM